MRRLFNYEKRGRPVASAKVFSRRLLHHGLYALGVIVVAQAIGMAGYMGFESMGFIDAFVNVAMILSGMGPMTPLLTDAGKIFAGFYALVSGVLILGVAGLIMAPVLHRLLHNFHVDDNDPKN